MLGIILEVPMEGYCLKCKQKNEMSDTENVVMANGRNAIKGKCSICGIGMFKIISQKDVSETKEK